jgi:hypothetical protein
MKNLLSNSLMATLASIQTSVPIGDKEHKVPVRLMATCNTGCAGGCKGGCAGTCTRSCTGHSR